MIGNLIPIISESKGIDVTRLYCGSYLTSLDMAGFSVTLLKPGIETLHWLGTINSYVIFARKKGIYLCYNKKKTLSVLFLLVIEVYLSVCYNYSISVYVPLSSCFFF